MYLYCGPEFGFLPMVDFDGNSVMQRMGGVRPSTEAEKEDQKEGEAVVAEGAMTDTPSTPVVHTNESEWATVEGKEKQKRGAPTGSDGLI